MIVAIALLSKDMNKVPSVYTLGEETAKSNSDTTNTT